MLDSEGRRTLSLCSHCSPQFPFSTGGASGAHLFYKGHEWPLQPHKVYCVLLESSILSLPPSHNPFCAFPLFLPTLHSPYLMLREDSQFPDSHLHYPALILHSLVPRPHFFVPAGKIGLVNCLFHFHSSAHE